jgi:hypothetical protein
MSYEKAAYAAADEQTGLVHIITWSRTIGDGYMQGRVAADLESLAEGVSLYRYPDCMSENFNGVTVMDKQASCDLSKVTCIGCIVYNMKKDT